MQGLQDKVDNLGRRRMDDATQFGQKFYSPRLACIPITTEESKQTPASTYMFRSGPHTYIPRKKGFDVYYSRQVPHLYQDSTQLDISLDSVGPSS